jgi:hypothetical protein
MYFSEIYSVFFLDTFFHFLYLIKMWEIFMPHPVYLPQCLMYVNICTIKLNSMICQDLKHVMVLTCYLHRRKLNAHMHKDQVSCHDFSDNCFSSFT